MVGEDRIITKVYFLKLKGKKVNGRSNQFIGTKLNKFTVEYTFQNYNQNVCNAKESSKQIGIPCQNMIKTIVFKDEDYNYVVCLLSSEDNINMNK